MALSAEEYLELKAARDADRATSGLSDEKWTQVDQAVQDYDNQNLQGYADAGPTMPEGVIGADDGAGGAAAVSPETLQSAADTGGVKEQVDKARAMNPVPAEPEMPDLVMSLNPDFDIPEQALAVQPATTHPKGDKAAEAEWLNSVPGATGLPVFVYEPPLSEVRKRLLEDPAFVRFLRPNLPPSPEEITGLASSDLLYTKAANYMWRETADAAAKAGKTAYRYSKAPWLHDGKAMRGLEPGFMKVLGSAVPASEGFESFIMGMDNTAAFGAARAAVDSAIPGAKEDTAQTVEDHPIAYTAGQIVGAIPGAAGMVGAKGLQSLSHWGPANQLWDVITSGGASLAGKFGGGSLARMGLSGASAGVAAAATQVGQEGVDAAASYAQTGEAGTTLEEASERVKGAGMGLAPMFGAAAEGMGQLASKGADALRGANGGRIGRAERGGTQFSPIRGAQLSPETQAVIERGKQLDLLPGDILAEEIAPKIAKAATDELEAAYLKSKTEQTEFGQTPEGRQRLPATTLVNRSVEMLDRMHGPDAGGLLKPLRADSAHRTAKRVFNNEVGTVSVKPSEGAIELSPEQAEAYLNPSRQRGLLPKGKTGSDYSLAGKTLKDLGHNETQPEKLSAVKKDAEFMRTGRSKGDKTGVSLIQDPERGLRLNDGRHRFTAAKEAGLPSVYGTVREPGSGKVLFQGDIPLKAPKAVEGDGLAASLQRRGIDKVYVQPTRRNAMEHEEVIRGLRVKVNDDPDVARQLKHAARQDRAPRGEHWQAMLSSHSDIIGGRKAVKRLLAAKGEDTAFNVLAGHGSRKPGELKKVQALRGAAEKGGASAELQQIRGMDDIMRLRGGQASAFIPSTRAGVIQKGIDKASVRAFPALRSLGGMTGPIRAGKGGRLDDIEDEEEEDLEDM